ncbi:MAG: peptidoglycan-binding domain-containing protein [Hyphomicrobiales bacterium]
MMSGPDGIAGERTRSAIMLFERRNGLQETGAVSGQLIAALERLATGAISPGAVQLKKIHDICVTRGLTH